MVTIGTLLIQGLTLPWLIKALNISDPREDVYRKEQHKLANRIAETATEEAVTAYREANPDPKVREGDRR